MRDTSKWFKSHSGPPVATAWATQVNSSCGVLGWIVPLAFIRAILACDGQRCFSRKPRAVNLYLDGGTCIELSASENLADALRSASAHIFVARTKGFPARVFPMTFCPTWVLYWGCNPRKVEASCLQDTSSWPRAPRWLFCRWVFLRARCWQNGAGVWRRNTTSNPPCGPMRRCPTHGYHRPPFTLDRRSTQVAHIQGGQRETCFLALVVIFNQHAPQSGLIKPKAFADRFLGFAPLVVLGGCPSWF